MTEYGTWGDHFLSQSFIQLEVDLLNGQERVANVAFSFQAVIAESPITSVDIRQFGSGESTRNQVTVVSLIPRISAYISPNSVCSSFKACGISRVLRIPRGHRAYLSSGDPDEKGRLSPLSLRHQDSLVDPLHDTRQKLRSYLTK